MPISMENVTIGGVEIDPSRMHAELRYALGLLSGKWKLEIMWHLYLRTHRFGELKRAVDGISQHMLTNCLRELEQDGLVSRVVFAEVPPRVEYSLTERSESLQPVIDALVRWAVTHRAVEQDA
ncbi:winged helix-turn-helix transcriptional regulator [Novosphingobium sp. BL-52-GroH]|uniref:winged helix-turn-helix transcriptional regulator n=1 Tax=Novosphingobium sp. BL-52-GroH TaxID=3349877 RepID=UPI00384C0308